MKTLFAFLICGFAVGRVLAQNKPLRPKKACEASGHHGINLSEKKKEALGCWLAALANEVFQRLWY